MPVFLHSKRLSRHAFDILSLEKAAVIELIIYILHDEIEHIVFVRKYVVYHWPIIMLVFVFHKLLVFRLNFARTD